MPVKKIDRTKLLSCAHCGSEAEEKWWSEYDTGDRFHLYYGYHIECTNEKCGCQTGIMWSRDKKVARRKARRIWNRRVKGGK